MFRIWGKIFKDNRLLADDTYIDESSESRTSKVFAGVDHFSYVFDLPKPIWLDKNISEFKRYSKTRFYKDSFIEDIDFDFLEIHVIEED